MLIHGWGRHPVVDAEIRAPLTPTSATSVLSECKDVPLIARGMGRSYGDSSLASHVISTAYLNLLLDFDRESGIVRCGAGVTLAELLDAFVPQGWFLPVTPGTKFVSVGGAIASDVHGKNHHLDGCFSEFVERFSLLLASGEIVTCSRSEHSDLFHATCGGMGLTGIILEASLRLKPIRSAMIDQTTFKAQNLAEAIELFEKHHDAEYSVAWIDCLATGNALGRSLVMLGRHSGSGNLSARSKRPMSVPVDMPAPLLNRFSIGAFNALYFHRIRRSPLAQQVHYEPYFYPLDGIHHWNRMYGKRGFTQYQFALPKAAGMEGMATILKRIAASGRGSFLAVLKAFGKENANLLSFPIEGYTLALDFKLEEALFPLLEELDAIVLDHGGRLYLTKDVRMSEATFKRSYPRWEAFQETRIRYGAQGRFASRQSQRLGMD
ncbi:FAD-binding oxidoreductase [Noviherbaspirillum massiliense]|uniref:FAD-binding oxidoreductase n=1 Tax=Noviherbaspirillum massiliense TaxID=1465823 RepID=UPI00047471B6|nr:FAD-binding oxidoreductase [Noviherbaspirillum massiliense]